MIPGCSLIADLPDVDVEADEDGSGGTVVIQGEDGDAVTIDSEAGGELPEWFPAEMPLPGTYTVLASSSMEMADGSMRQVTVSASEGFDDVMTIIDDGLAAAGATPEGRQVFDQGEDRMAIVRVVVAGMLWTITVAADPESDQGIIIAYATISESD